jgi:hypothetical protein
MPISEIISTICIWLRAYHALTRYEFVEMFTVETSEIAQSEISVAFYRASQQKTICY